MADICSTVVLPPIETNFCNPDVYFAQIEKILVGNPDQPAFADWTVDTEWIPRLDNANSTDNTYIRTFSVKASKPAPEVSSFEIDRGRTINATQSNTINFVIYDVSDDTRDFFKYVNEQNGITVPFWYTTRDHQYGSNEGMDGTLNGYEIIVDDRNAAITIEGTITWEGALEERVTLLDAL